MRIEQGPMLQSLRGVETFVDHHADKLAGVVQTGAKDRLTRAIAALDDHVAMQAGGVTEARSLTQKQQALRVRLLRDHMASIARIARADLPNTPELSVLRMPKGRPTVARLAQSVDGMVPLLQQHAAVFTAAGMPADFIPQLTAAADELLESVDERSQSRNRARGATAGLKAKLSEGRKVVWILDSFVTTALKDDAALLAEWRATVRLPQRGGRPTGSTPSGSTPSTGSGTSTTTSTTAVSTTASTAAPTPAPTAPSTASASPTSSPAAA